MPRMRNPLTRPNLRGGRGRDSNCSGNRGQTEILEPRKDGRPKLRGVPLLSGMLIVELLAESSLTCVLLRPLGGGLLRVDPWAFWEGLNHPADLLATLAQAVRTVRRSGDYSFEGWRNLSSALFAPSTWRFRSQRCGLLPGFSLRDHPSEVWSSPREGIRPSETIALNPLNRPGFCRDKMSRLSQAALV